MYLDQLSKYMYCHSIVQYSYHIPTCVEYMYPVYVFTCTNFILVMYSYVFKNTSEYIRIQKPDIARIQSSQNTTKYACILRIP